MSAGREESYLFIRRHLASETETQRNKETNQWQRRRNKKRRDEGRRDEECSEQIAANVHPEQYACSVGSFTWPAASSAEDWRAPAHIQRERTGQQGKGATGRTEPTSSRLLMNKWAVCAADVGPVMVTMRFVVPSTNSFLRERERNKERNRDRNSRRGQG